MSNVQPLPQSPTTSSTTCHSTTSCAQFSQSSVNNLKKQQDNTHDIAATKGPSGVTKRRRNSVFTRVQPYESVFVVESCKTPQWVMYKHPHASNKKTKTPSRLTKQTASESMQCGSTVSGCNTSTQRKGRLGITWNDLFN